MLRVIKRYLQFSTTIKNSQNPSNPIKNNPTQAEAGKQKYIKISRKKIDMQQLKPIKREYETKQDIHTKAQNAYHENIKQKIQQNLATKKFYEYELKRGEDLIDNVPVDPYYEYKLSDLQAEVQNRKKMIKNLQGVEEFVDPQRYQKLKNLIDNFQYKKHRYERDLFFKKIQQYPGSARGPNPEDDPEKFGQYVDSIMSPYLRAEIMAESKEKNMQNITTIQQQSYEIPPPLTNMLSTDLSDILKRKKTKSVPKQQINEDQLDQQGRQILLENIEASSPSARYEDVPVYPYSAFQEYHSYMSKLKTWSQFRKNYDQFHYKKKIKRTIDFISGILQSRKEKQDLERSEQNKGKGTKKKYSKRQKLLKQKQDIRKGVFKFTPSIYSLYTYYKTLPKQIQSHPGVKMTYLGLQYCSPDIPYEKKQQILNLAAKTSLPMDKFSTAVMEKILNRTREYLTPHLTDRILNMNPQFTWDIHEFLNEVKDEKLRTISTVKQQQKSYVQPPDLTKITDSHLANLPVDFYDNEDGFWDSYIDEKLKRYQKVKPLGRGPKKYFVH